MRNTKNSFTGIALKVMEKAVSQLRKTIFDQILKEKLAESITTN
jgi:hypothetical protein